MPLDDLHPFLTAFYETIVGLRKGEAGRANSNLTDLTSRISDQLAIMPTTVQKAAYPVISSMLHAQQRNDAINLADTLQYELPTIRPFRAVSSLLSISLLARLREIDALNGDHSKTENIARSIRSFYQEDPFSVGICAYFAGPLLKDDRVDDAVRLLTIDEDAGRRTPANAFLLALGKARQGAISEAAALMQWVYDNDTEIRNGFSRLAQICADMMQNRDALDLATQDRLQDRITPVWQIELAFHSARQGDFESAVALIEDAYQRDKTLKDANARVAWLKHKQDGRKAPGIVQLLDRDWRLDRLSSEAMLVSSKYYIWQGRYADAEQMVQQAYDADPAARGGFGRLAIAALVAHDPSKADAFWAKDRTLARSTERTDAIYAFMTREQWSNRQAPTYVYRSPDDPEYRSIEPLLDQAYAAIGRKAVVEVPQESRAIIPLRYPGWRASNGSVFGAQFPTIPIGKHWKRLSYGEIKETWQQ